MVEASGGGDMVSWRRGLAVLGGVTAVAVLSNELYYPYDKEVSQLICDYIVDPAALAVLGRDVLVNVADSLRIRSRVGNHLAQWPRDVVTALVAIVWVRYLMQYTDKIAPDHEATAGLWGHLMRLGHRHPGLRSHCPVAVGQTRTLRWSRSNLNPFDRRCGGVTGPQASSPVWLKGYRLNWGSL